MRGNDVVLTILAALLAVTTVANRSEAADALVGVDINSAYVYHGITYNNGLVVQPWLDVSAKGFGVSIWSNFDIDDFDSNLNASEFSEVDLKLYYALTVRSFDLSLSIAEYTFPNIGVDSSTEVIFSAERALIKGLSTKLKLHYNVSTVHDIYASLGVNYSFNPLEKLSLKIGATGAYAGEDMSVGTEGGLNDYVVSLSGTYQATEAFSIGASINHAGTADEDVLPLATADNPFAQDVDWFGGVSATLGF